MGVEARVVKQTVAPLSSVAPPPMALLAELTHRCPLACPYCSNPLELTGIKEELSTEEWIRVFQQAAEMGVCICISLAGSRPRGAIWSS